MKQIIVDVSPDGEVKATTKGWFGSACKAASKFLEALGLVKSDVPTAEAYQTAKQRGEVQQ